MPFQETFAATLCCQALLPAVYQTAGTFWLAAGSQAAVFDIIEQMEWFDLINETLQAFLIIPLYTVFNRAYKEQKDGFAGLVFKMGLVVLLLYTAFSTGTLVCGSGMIRAMHAGGADLAAVRRYLYLATIIWMFGFGMVVHFVISLIQEKLFLKKSIKAHAA